MARLHFFHLLHSIQPISLPTFHRKEADPPENFLTNPNRPFHRRRNRATTEERKIRTSPEKVSQRCERMNGSRDHGTAAAIAAVAFRNPTMSSNPANLPATFSPSRFDRVSDFDRYCAQSTWPRTPGPTFFVSGDFRSLVVLGMPILDFVSDPRTPSVLFRPLGSGTERVSSRSIWRALFSSLKSDISLEIFFETSSFIFNRLSAPAAKFLCKNGMK